MTREKIFYLLAATIVVVAFVTSIPQVELRGEEPRRAIVTMEMALSDNYVVPRIYDWPYYNKLPFFNWVMVGIFRLTGSHGELAARLPGVISLLLLAFFNVLLCKKYIDLKTGVYSSLVMLSFVDILTFGSIYTAEIDPFYALITWLQVVPVLLFFEKRKYVPLFLLSYAFMTMGFLTKGLPSVAFQGLTLLAVFIVGKRFVKLFHWAHFLSFGLFVGALAWYFYSYSKQGDWLLYLSRVITETSGKTGVGESFLLVFVKGILRFPIQLLGGYLMPWSLLGVFMYKTEVNKHIRGNELLRFAVLFITANILFYWISPIDAPRYVYPFFPFFAVILVRFYIISKENETRLHYWFEQLLGAIMLVFTVGLVALFFVKELKEITYLVPVTVLGIFVFGFLTYQFYERAMHRFLFFASSLFLARIFINFIYLPVLDSQVLRYKEYMTKVNEITKSESVTAIGFPHKVPVSIIGGARKDNKNDGVLDYPVRLPFQVPYYYSLQKGEVLGYGRNVLSGKLHLVHESFLTGWEQIEGVDSLVQVACYPYEELYRFYDRVTHEDLLLVRGL